MCLFNSVIELELLVFFLDLPRFSGVKGEQDNWMQWIDDSNSDEIFDLPHIDIDVEEFVGGNSHLDC